MGLSQAEREDNQLNCGEAAGDFMLWPAHKHPFGWFLELGWPESAWIASRNERDALGIALTGMLQDGEISRKGASELIQMVLHGNAEALYKLPPPKAFVECADPLCSNSLLK